MTTTWPRYRDECEAGPAGAPPGYPAQSCAYSHDCGGHVIEQEGRAARLGQCSGEYSEQQFPRPAHGGSELPGGGQDTGSLPQGRSRERREKRHGDREHRERREGRSQGRSREVQEPEPPPPPPPEPEQPGSVAPQLGHPVGGPGGAHPVGGPADCADCALAQAQQVVQLSALGGGAGGQLQGSHGQHGMEPIETINPGKEEGGPAGGQA